MRAFVVHKHEHPSKLSLTADAADPIPGPGEVLVEVYSAGMNFFDILQSQGKYQNQPPLPFVLGSEFAGMIADDSPIPSGCPFKPGDRVFGAAQGAYAEKIAARWDRLLTLPANMTYDQGAGLFVTWPTSYEALVGRADLKPGEWVLVTASAGGVGLAAVQLAKALGAKVIAAAGSQEKLDVSTRYGGADFTVDYTKPNWQQEVLKITGGKGVDVIYDPVGLIKDSLKCIAWKGRALVVGFAAGQIEKLPLNLVLLKNISIVGIHWGAYTQKESSRIPPVWKALLGLFASGRATPVVYTEVFPLERLSDGLSALEQRKTWGKVVVRVRDDELGVSRAKL
ncbi:Quinone oxidoreductase-like protein [Sparassis crispa]|uniref:Quinone oxidoreductase-like protein n=1 Tax=Sparassis crispa TaxID=139825 RepID=A0A401GFY1_9APHY|nr:Quinone oxidoreductase-like protein [Sparassis crispa]GBE81072.1 Quinone oxidoreductase-like protein [Sparassis crispa]